MRRRLRKPGNYFSCRRVRQRWLGAFLAYGYLAVADWPVREALVGALVVCLIYDAGRTGACPLSSNGFGTGRIRPGSYPLWGWFYWRFWFVRTLMRAAPVPYLAGTPFLAFITGLMGARIGQDVYIGGAWTGDV